MFNHNGGNNLGKLLLMAEIWLTTWDGAETRRK